MHESLKTHLFKYLRSKPNEWIHGEELRRLGDELGYMTENAGRRLRELETAGRIEKKLEATKDHHKTTWYRYVQSPYELLHHQVATNQAEIINNTLFA